MKKQWKKTKDQSLSIKEKQKMVSILTELAKKDLYTSLKNNSKYGETNFFEELYSLAFEIPLKYDSIVKSIMGEYSCHHDLINGYADDKKSVNTKLPKEVIKLKKLQSNYDEFFSWFEFVANDLGYIFDQLEKNYGQH